MHHRKTRTCIALLASAFLAAGTAFAQQDSNKALLDLLVRKGILTPDDVAGLQKELAAQQAQAPATAAPAAAAPSSEAPAAPAPAAPAAVPAVQAGGGPAYGGAAAAGVPVPMTPGATSPLSFRIGVADFTPFGFMDLTGVYRSEATGSAIGTTFNSIPYPNGSTGQLSETKFSAQNSRLGLRIDSTVNDTKVLGYVETDFLGNAPTNLGVTSNSDTLRMRVYFADLRQGPWEFLAGQDWSLLTPNRSGASPMPSDIFYSNNMDTNYQLGLTWARQAQIRAIYHATNEFTMAVSVENPDQYVGSAVVLPAAFTASEVDQGTATSQPNLLPDFIGKLAYDTRAVNGLPWHFEVSGLLSSYKINTYTAAVNGNATAEGEGGQVATDIQIVKGLSFIGTGFYSYGGGRYLFGSGPDFVVTPPDASGAYQIGLVRAESAILGFEYAVVPQDTVSAYWSEAEFGQRYDKLGASYVGYGYPGSSNADNRTLHEYTLANTYTFWKNPSYGALQLIGQISHLDREPWFVAPHPAPSEADATMVWLDLRYVLP